MMTTLPPTRGPGLATVGIVGMDSNVPVERGGLVSCSEMAVRRDLPRDVMMGYDEKGIDEVGATEILHVVRLLGGGGAALAEMDLGCRVNDEYSLAMLATQNQQHMQGWYSVCSMLCIAGQ